MKQLRTSQPKAELFKKNKNTSVVQQLDPTKRKIEFGNHKRTPSDLRSESYEKTSYYKDFENDLMFIRNPTESSRDGEIKFTSRTNNT